MKKVFIFLSVISFAAPSFAEVRFRNKVVSFNADRVCANLIGIPKNSKNVSYEEWEQFQSCIRYFDLVDGVY
jgi:hypothetical protein